jgi:hypothetical protein
MDTTKEIKKGGKIEGLEFYFGDQGDGNYESMESFSLGDEVTDDLTGDWTIDNIVPDGIHQAYEISCSNGSGENKTFSEKDILCFFKDEQDRIAEENFKKD